MKHDKLSTDLSICLARTGFSPEHSTFYTHQHNPEPYAILAQDIARVQVAGGSVLLVGDFIAQTGIMLDFETKIEHADLPEVGLPSIGDAPLQLYASMSDSTAGVARKKRQPPGDAQCSKWYDFYNASALASHVVHTAGLVTASQRKGDACLPARSAAHQ